jgi:hypothetical protein
MDEKPYVITSMGDPELDQIRADMNLTKRNLERTIYRMREYFSRDRMKRKTQDMVEGWWQSASILIQAKVGDMRGAADLVGRAVRENPVPIAIVGAAGLGAMAYRLFKRRSREQDLLAQEYIAGEERVSGVYGSETCPKGVRHAYSEGSTARGTLEESSGHPDRTGVDFRDTVREHPFITGTAMFCMGILGGLLIPPMKQEEELIGSASDVMNEKAQEKEDVLESAKRLAEQAEMAALEEAEKQGFRAAE